MSAFNQGDWRKAMGQENLNCHARCSRVRLAATLSGAMMRFALCLASVFAATTLNADPNADLQRLMQAMPGLSVGLAPEEQLASAEALLSQIEGRWMPLAPLLGGKLGPIDEELLQTACDKIGRAFTRRGMLGFDITLMTKGVPFVTHLQFAGGNAFVSTFDDDGLRSRLFGDKTDIDANMLFGALLRTDALGYVSIHSAGADLLLVQGLARPADVWARCP
jgi:hypothetical protein